MDISSDKTVEGLRPHREATRAKRLRARRFLNSKTLTLGSATVVVAYLVLVPLVTLVAASFQSNFLGENSAWTLSNYAETLSNGLFYRLFATSLIYAVSTTFVAMVLGVGLGWLYARTDVPLKRFGFMTVMLPFIVPGILYAVSWIILLSPEIGIYNVAFKAGTGHLLFDIYSLPGMVLVESLHNAPLAFLMSVAIFSSMDSTLEEAAYVAGYSAIGVFRKIALRLAWPGLLGAALLIFIRALSGFEVPQLIGVPGHVFVFVSQIYAAANTFPPDYGQISVLGDFILMVCLVGLYFSTRVTRRSERFATITGKGFRPSVIPLGKWRRPCGAIFVAVFLLTSGGPLFALIWSSLLPEYQIPSWALLEKLSFNNYAEILEYPSIVKSFFNSTVAALVTGIVTMLLTTLVAYVTVKTKVRGARLLDNLVFIPIAMPGIIISIGILFWYLIAPLPFSLYGTLTILIITFITISMPYGMRYMSAGLMQINDELEEAARVSGASWITVLRRVYFPLLVPSFLAGMIFVVITVFREVSAAILLYTQGSQVVSITLFSLWNNGQYTVTAALGVLIVILLVLLFLGFQWLASKSGLVRAG